jgi:hypothetical protein
MGGESLSSWRQRVGQENGYWKYPMRANRGGYLDPDRIHGKDELRWLSELTKITDIDISRLTLDAAVTLISNTSQPSKPRWAISAREDVTTRAGPMCCPLCLASDAIPYFRIHWRLAHISYCEIHQTRLIDRCPVCNGSLWPSPIRSPKMKPWLSLRHCQFCGEDLAGQVVRLRPSHQQRNVIPVFESEIDQKSYWDGVHTLCQLMLRKAGHNLASSDYMANKTTCTHGLISWRHIEEVPLQPRAKVVSNCEDLLHDWPKKFVTIALATGISKVSFSGLELPAWLTDVVESQLVVRRRNRYSREFIQGIIAAEASRHGIISKAKIRRSLGVVENSVLNKLISQRRRAGTCELMQMLNLFRLEIASTSSERSKLTSLLRDYLIFLLSVISQTPVLEVCQWSRQRCFNAIETALNDMRSEFFAIVVREAQHLLGTYQSTNPTNDSSHTGYYFVTRFGLPVADHSVRRRVSAMMKFRFKPDLWQSVDVFTKVFLIATHSRRQRLLQTED